MNITADALIIGAGQVGTAQAIALARGGLRVALVERQGRDRSFDTRSDGRASAIARSSRYVFEHIGIWEALRERAEPIRDIRVVDAYSRARVHYDHREGDGQPFGHIIPNAHLLPTLLAAAEKQENLELQFDAELLALETDAGGVTATFSGGGTCRAALLLAADGRFSKTRGMLGIKARILSYGQTAMVSVIAHEQPHRGVALERFMPSGPFALLPLRGDRCGVVWSEPDAVAALMMRLPDAEYAAEIRRRAGDYLGAVSMEGERFSHPLGIVLTRRTIAPRAALIGDAAHAMHPIAGQGVNVGYRDVALLTELLLEAHRLGLDIGGSGVLERYRRGRRADVLSMLAATDGINRLFSTDALPLKLARRLGLTLVERAPRLKHYFMFRAMGLTGDLPEMLKREAA